MEKKGQFYLIAAIIIAMVIISLATITNYTVERRKPVKFYDLGSELSEESSRVIDYGIYNEKDIPEIIENFTDEYFLNYTKEKEKYSELVFIYGNQDDAKLATYTSEATGLILVTSGGTSLSISGVDKYAVNRISLGTTNNVEVDILNVTYNFTIEDMENFLFIITKKTDEEKYIISG
jgi:hypothetical protein